MNYSLSGRRALFGAVLIGGLGLLASLLFAAAPAYAADTITASTYIDADGDGQVDHAKITFDENIDQCDYEAGDWSVDTAGTIAVTAITGISTDDPESTGDGVCDGTDAIIYVDLTTTADITGGATNPEITYTNGTTSGSLSGTTTAEISTFADQALTDAAAPTVASVSPTEGVNNTNRYANIVITFSEPMVTDFDEGTEFSISPDPGTFTDTWSVGNTVVTLDLAGSFSCSTTYTVTTTEANIDASAGSTTTLITTGSEDGDWPFLNICINSSAEPTPPKTYGVEITSPSASQQLTAGDSVKIKWEASGTGYFGFVDLFYSIDGGVTYTEIATQEMSDGSYTWTVPDVSASDVTLLINGTDLVETVASYVTEGFSIVQAQEDTSEETPVEEDDGYGVSPVTGERELIDDVSPGDYIRGASYDTVYYIDTNMKRHPFSQSQIFFTWQEDFDNVRTVTDATLSSLTLGTPMLPKPDTVLVKIMSVAKVYAITEDASSETGATLRYISSESVAEDLYGSAWADYVIDIDDTLLARFAKGSGIFFTTDLSVEKGIMKTRAELNS